jgi:peptidoglycan/LPS O-acetylase OafA/YrhL
MRPFAQAAVIATHALIFFAPLATSNTVASLLVLTRFSRESFFFITALVLTFVYIDELSVNLKEFWKRRLLLTGVPYLVWTVIYYVFISSKQVTGFPYYHAPAHYLISASGLHEFLTLLVTGYYQLYFIVVLFQFYVLFPLLLVGLRRARRWHVHILIAAVIWQILYDEMIRHHWLPFNYGGKLQTRLIISYPIYFLGGMIAALNYQAFHSWLMRHARLVFAATLASAALAIGLNYVTNSSFTEVYLAPHSDVLAPLAILYNVGAVLCLYLVGVFLVSRNRARITRRVVASTSNASYGIYLSQMIWIPMLVRISMKVHAPSHVSWPYVVVFVVVVVFSVGYVLSVLLMRTPLGPAIVGRRYVRWRDSTLLP